MRLSVASEGCSVRLKGLAQLVTFCRGLKGSVQRFRRFNRTEVRKSLLRQIVTKTGDHEKLESCDGRVPNLWPKKVQKGCARHSCVDVGRPWSRILVSIICGSHRLCSS